MQAPRAGREPHERHTPVLLQETLEYLAVRPEGVYLDCTVGLAGHSSAIAERLGPGGRLIGLDRDGEALELARARLAGFPNVGLVHAEFSRAAEFAPPGELDGGGLDGILADFGTSSMHFDEAHRGFSFQAEGPLDMRMNPQGEESTAAQVVNEADERELANLIYELGEERRSRRIARAIVRARPLSTTAQLAAVIKAAAPAMNPGIHPATRTFQALRIHVNRELDEIRALLGSAPALLKPGGRLVMISFHSLEDRLAKDALREGREAGYYQVLTRKPLTAGEEETRRNPRSRSAKLRAAEKINAPAKRSGR